MSDLSAPAINRNILSKEANKFSFLSIFKYVILIAITVVVFLPILITLFASLKTPMQLGSDFPLKPPDITKLYFENYQTVFIKGKILMGFRNSILLVLASVAINAILGSMTAFTLCRFQFRFKRVIMALFMLGMVIPAYITEIARFPVIKSLHLYNTIGAPIIIYAATDLMQIYIYTQFVNKISLSIDESAMIDGSSYLLFIPLELMVAVLLDSKIRAQNFFKTVAFMPYIVNGVAIAYAFSFFLQPV